MPINVTDEHAAEYERRGYEKFMCRVCGQIGYVEFPYEDLGACSRCVCKLATAFLMKHAGDMDPRFCSKAEYEAFCADREAGRPKKKATIGHALRKRILERDAYRCQLCGDHRDLQVDHVFPESRGGTLEESNLRCLCKPCNIKKGSKVGP